MSNSFLATAMPSESQRRKGLKGVRSGIGAAIRHLNHARDTCGIPQAQGAFGSVSDLLSVAGVRSSLFCDGEPLAHVPSGPHDLQSGLRCTWTVLRRCM